MVSMIVELYLQINDDFKYQEHIQSICQKWIEGILYSHLPGGDDDKVPAEGNLLIDDLISFPAIHELFVSDE